jgi:hypothetical protein
MDPSDASFPGSWPPGDPLPRRREPHPSPPRSDAHGASSSPRPTPTTPADPAGSSSNDGTPKKPRTWKPRTCRICLETINPTFHPPSSSELGGIFGSGPRVSYDSDGGRLISPCRCKGSSKYVHEKCLQMWRHADSSGMRNFYKCPTCLFSYRLARLEWGQVISSVGE